MRKVLTIILAGPAIANSAVPLAAAETSKVAAAVGRCEKLNTQWRGIEYSLVENEAAGVADDSAPRATMRAVQDNGSYIQAMLLLEMLRSNGCPLPKEVPSGITYLTNALECRTDRESGVKDSPKCDYSKWTRTGE